jgi:hypothetical protein
VSDVNALTRLAGAVLCGLGGAVILAGVTAGPALAHTGVTVEPKVAGSPNALVTVTAAAESNTAGIVSLKVVLPPGIPPADVTWVGGPAGWALAPDADGYTVAGPALPVGRDARHQVRVKQLPLVPTLAFKILQTYSDGRIDRWIEVPQPGAREPDTPAPVVTLAAPPGGFPAPAPSAPPSVAPPSSAVPPTPADSSPPIVVGPPIDRAADSGPGALPWAIAVVVLVAALTAAALLTVRRRRRAATPDPADPA